MNKDAESWARVSPKAVSEASQANIFNVLDMALQDIKTMASENERLRAGYRAIMKAAVEGRVCDDVAWFDAITTLHDFCDLMLNADAN
jgi:hypothetical protein